MQWRFYRQGWQKSWGESAHLPDGVELTLTMENGETWRWVFTTPGDMPEAAAPQPGTETAAPAAENAPAPQRAPAPDVKP